MDWLSALAEHAASSHVSTFIIFPECSETFPQFNFQHIPAPWLAATHHKFPTLQRE